MTRVVDIRRAALPALSLLFLACGEGAVPAVGPNSHVSLFTTLADDDPALTPLIDSFSRTVYTTKTEEAFQVEVTSPEFYADYREFRNLVLAAALDQGGEMPRIIEQLVGGEVYREFQESERPFAVYSDVYATGQTVIVVAAPDPAALREITEEHAPALYDTLEHRVRMGLRKSLYLRGENRQLRDYLKHENWRIRIPKDYVAEEDLVRTMVVAHTEAPERWIFIQNMAMPADAFTPGACLELRRESPRLYEDEILVDSELEIEKTTFAGRPGYRLSGRWQSPSFTVGGPFVMYAIHDGSRLYVVDFLIFLPGLDKYPYVRQLEVIASTFELTPAS